MSRWSPWGPAAAGAGAAPGARLARRSGLRHRVVGSGGTGKSYLLVALAIAALTGGDVAGDGRDRVRSVLYVDAELDADTRRSGRDQVARGLGLRPPAGALPLVAPPRGLATAPGGCTTCPAGEPGHADGAGAGGARRRAGAGPSWCCFDSLTIGSAGPPCPTRTPGTRCSPRMERWGVPGGAASTTRPKSGHGQVGSFMKNAKVRGGLALERTAEGTITVEHSKPQFGGKLPDWRIRPVFDRAAGTVRFEALGADGQPLRGTAGPAPAVGAKVRRWGKQEQLVLDAYATHGPAVPMVVAEHLRAVLGERAEKVVWAATPKLEQAEAIVRGGQGAPGRAGRAGPRCGTPP